MAMLISIKINKTLIILTFDIFKLMASLEHPQLGMFALNLLKNHQKSQFFNRWVGHAARVTRRITPFR